MVLAHGAEVGLRRRSSEDLENERAIASERSPYTVEDNLVSTFAIDLDQVDMGISCSTKKLSSVVTSCSRMVTAARDIIETLLRIECPTLRG